MEKIIINVSKDKLIADITISTSQDKFPSKSQIYDTISKAGITVGIDHAVLDKIIADKREVENLVFAEGEASVKGDDSILIWYVDLNTSLRPTITERGKVDFKHLIQCEPVEKDQELVSKLPPTEGTSGMTVTGETIYSPG